MPAWLRNYYFSETLRKIVRLYTVSAFDEDGRTQLRFRRIGILGEFGDCKVEIRVWNPILQVLVDNEYSSVILLS